MRMSNLRLVSLLSWLIAIGMGFGLAVLGKGEKPFIQVENQIQANLTEKAIGISLKAGHPRLTPPIKFGPELNQYLANFRLTGETFCEDKRLTSQITCLAFTGSSDATEQLLFLLETQQLERCTAAGNKNNAWQLAIALDQVKAANPHADLTMIEQKLAASLQQCLEVLDGANASLWHGRFSLGAEAFIVAASLFDSGDLLERAYYHFKQSVMALALTEGWPGGYNYWVQNRGLTFYLAVNTYLQSGDDEEFKTELKHLAQRNGLWHIYMTRPDGRVQATGDEGSRTDLREESKKVVDLIARISGDPAVATFANYIHHQHGRASYYRDDFWLIPFTYDPDIDQLVADRGLEVFDNWLPNQAIFGRDYLNQIILRTGWKENDSYVLINGGQQFSHHQHADAGHFTYIYKGNPVAVDGAVYDGVLSDFRLYYGIRSTAKNLLNVSFADTDYQPTQQFKTSQADGTQHLSMPHGSAIRSVEHWMQVNQRSNKYNRASLLSFTPGAQSQVTLDLTAAYLYDNNNQGRIIRDFNFEQDGSLQIKDSIRQLDGVLLSHLNLPALEHSYCIDNNTLSPISLSETMQLTISTQGSPACQAPFSEHFMAVVERQLDQQKKLSKGKDWSDGAFHILTGAIETEQGNATVTFDFRPLK